MKTVLYSLMILFIIGFTTIESYSQFKKAVLFEMFTNAHCGACAGAYGNINSILKPSQYSEDIVYIFYHVSTYSDDALFQQSIKESNPRGVYYGIKSTPTVFIDGVQTGSLNWLNSVGARTQKSHNISINPTVYITNDNVVIDVTALSPNDYSNAKLSVVVVENVNYLGRNNVSQHQFVMRTMPTTPTGKDISLQANIPFSNMFTVPLNPIWNQDSIGVVIFIQDPTTKEVYASTVVPYNQVSKITSVQNDKPSFPVSVLQSSKSSTQFVFESVINQNGLLQIFDIMGNEVFSKNFVGSQNKQSIEWNGTDKSNNSVSNGIYLFKIEIGTLVSTGKFSL